MIGVSGEQQSTVGSWEPAAGGAGEAIPGMEQLVISEWGPSRLRGGGTPCFLVSRGNKGVRRLGRALAETGDVQRERVWERGGAGLGGLGKDARLPYIRMPRII